MGFKSGLIVGLGVGYVLGSKAGRERYEQIMESVNEATARPEVQDLVAKGKGLMDKANEVARSQGADPTE
ncbi:MAG: hypothetical protein ACR2OI_06000 [Acidimicrobiia bacterium]